MSEETLKQGQMNNSIPYQRLSADYNCQLDSQCLRYHCSRRTHEFVDEEHGEVRLILSQDEVMNCGLGFATGGSARVTKQIVVTFLHLKNTINNMTR